MKKENIMIDLETLGTSPDSAILSIGAVTFDKDGIGDEFYVNVDLKSSIKVGASIDPETVYWWLSQSCEAGIILSKDRLNVTPALDRLSEFFRNCSDNVKVWANSPSFDCVMLHNYFKRIGYSESPWRFYNERDFRTFLALTNAERVKPDVVHNALEDAKAQAQTIINYWNK